MNLEPFLGDEKYFVAVLGQENNPYKYRFCGYIVKTCTKCNNSFNFPKYAYVTEDSVRIVDPIGHTFCENCMENGRKKSKEINKK